MNHSERKLSPVAQALFEDSFVPYVIKAYKSVAKVSYLSDEDAKKWRSSKYNAYTKASILHAAEMYFVLNFTEEDKVLRNAKIVDDLTNLMAQYLTPYFVKAVNAPSEAEVYKNLKQKLHKENTFLNKIQEHVKSEKKRAKRQRAKVRNRLNLISIRAVLKFVEDVMDNMQQQESKQHKRARIIRYPNGKIESVQKSTEEFGKLKQEIAKFKTHKRNQNKK